MSTATDYPQFEVEEEVSHLSPELKAEWVEALRGDDYSQGREMLRIAEEDGTHTYCCLGVLCDLVAPGNWTDGQAFVFGDGPLDYGLSFPPDTVYDVTGLVQHDAEQLAEMNDAGHSFDDIADWIEENL